MNIDDLKKDAELRAEHDKYKVLYQAKKDQIRQSEIRNIKQLFKRIFTDAGFTITEALNSVTATFQNTPIVLSENVDYNRRDLSMGVYMDITLNNKKYEVATSIYPSKESAQSIETLTDQQRMQRDLEYYKEVADGSLTYRFKYIMATGERKEYETIAELIKAIPM